MKGSPQITSANRKHAILWPKIICKIGGPSANVTICGFASRGPNLFCDLQT
jgi:hypothetical protein